MTDNADYDDHLHKDRHRRRHGNFSAFARGYFTPKTVTFGLIALAVLAGVILLLTTHPFFDVPRMGFRAMLLSEAQRNKYAGFRPTSNWTCDRITLPASSEEFYVKYVLPRKPVVITGGLDKMGWRTDQWTVDYLDKKAGGVTVRFEHKDPTDSKFGQVGEQRGFFRWFLRTVYAPTNNDIDPKQYYLNLQDQRRGVMMQPPLTYLTNDFTVPPFFLSTALHTVNMWMGNADDVKGGRSAVHHDGGDNIYALVEGRKTANLWAPGDAFNMYTMGTIADITPVGQIHYVPGSSLREPHFSYVRDTDNYDVATYPRFADAVKATCAVNSGDMLFIPSGWFHEVSSFGRTLALNFWAAPPNPDEVVEAAEAARRPPPVQRTPSPS